MTCIKCKRKPKGDETFFVATVLCEAGWKKSLCPDCSKKLSLYLNQFKIKFRKEQDKRKLKWLGIMPKEMKK